MNTETDPRFIAMLERIVGQAKEMQQAGRLADPSSRREVAMLEHRLRVLQAQAQAQAHAGNPEESRETSGHAALVADWAREVRKMSAGTRGHTRQIRKELYQLRLITGSAAG